MRLSSLGSWLSRAHPAAFSAYAIGAAFSTYFSMYAYRKAFAAGTFEGDVDFVGVTLTYKSIYIVSQVLGYCLSKFAGIKVVSEMSYARRASSILISIALAWAALLAFAVVPQPYAAICLFFNGLPLGMVWGLVFGFLEGRRVSEVLGAGLSASYILASGAVKAVGRALVVAGVPEQWMPFVTGAIFALPMIVFVFLLAQLPPPNEDDERRRTRREPMNAAARRAFFRQFAPGLLALTALYVVLTAYRDYRDNFAVEIWSSLGFEEEPSILALSELPVTVGVLVALAFLMFIRDNRVALTVVHIVMALGTLVVGVATALFAADIIGPAAWMIAIGFGLYVAYVPYGCILFDRLIAAVGAVGTAGFLIYVTDAFGYLGSVGILLYKDFAQAELSSLQFVIRFSYVTCAFCTLLMLGSLWYFRRRTGRAL